MKDVSDLVAKRLEKLEKGFSLEWLSDFWALTQSLTSNAKNRKIIQIFIIFSLGLILGILLRKVAVAVLVQ